MSPIELACARLSSESLHCYSPRDYPIVKAVSVFGPLKHRALQAALYVAGTRRSVYRPSCGTGCVGHEEVAYKACAAGSSARTGAGTR